MGTCDCAPPARLHMVPSGVHLPGGAVAGLVLVDEVWSDGEPTCSVCATTIESTFFRCRPCDAVICRRCVAGDTEVVECECDCLPEVAVTGVQLAAIRASAQVAAAGP